MSDLEGFGFVLPHWAYWGWLAIMPLIMMWLDRRTNLGSSDVEASGVETPVAETSKEAIPSQTADEQVVGIRQKADPAAGNIVTHVIDWISEHTGVFVAFWTVNAVCFYFFEVVMRYLFNMPTIWVHEASYLLFGMQYLMAGAFAMLHGAHVRVDVVYNKLPPRGQVGMDIFTSIFFFIFAIALLGTSWRFFIDSYQMHETTVETWGIQYYPVKFIMMLGAILILLAGLSKLIKDVKKFIVLGRRPTAKHRSVPL